MAETQAAPAEPASALAPAAPAKKSKLLIVVPLVLVLLGGSAAGIWFLRSRSAPIEPKPDTGPQVKSTLHLETFVINLADPDQKAYLRVGIDIGINRELKGKEGEAGPPVALIRDSVVGVLSLCKPDELLTAEGKLKLKQDLLQALQERAPELGATEIYFTEFLIQR